MRTNAVFLFLIQTTIFLLSHLNVEAGRATQSCTAILTQIPESRTALREALQIFAEFSDLRRASAGESEARIKIIEKVKSAMASGRALTWKVDKVGNLMVEIPATGRFVGKDLKPIGIQGHLDIIEKVEPQAGDLETYYKMGIPLELVDGNILRAKDHLSTLGADNYGGVSAMIRYIENQAIEHPPLKLFFTVEEETSFNGAFNFEFPISDLTVLISLDGIEHKSVCSGCAGGFTYELDGNFTNNLSSIPSDYEIWTIKLANLSGGHSGVDIHLKRANALNVWFDIVDTLPSNSWILHSSVGTGRSAIPSELDFTIALPKILSKGNLIRRLNRFLLNRKLERTLRGLKRNFKDETKKSDISLAMTKNESSSFTEGLRLSDIKRNLRSLRNLIPQGILNSDKVIGPTTVNNNILTLVNGVINSSGFVRTYIDADIQTHIQRLKDGTEKNPSIQFKVNEQLPPWFEDKAVLKSRLPQLVTDAWKFGATLGVVEFSALKQKAPDVPMLVLGMDLKDEHTTSERLNIDSLETTMQMLQRILEDAP